jgi:lipid-A-disaccharide synthase-like uncharacterized protein
MIFSSAPLRQIWRDDERNIVENMFVVCETGTNPNLNPLAEPDRCHRGGIGQIIPLAAHARGWNTGRVIIPAIFLATILDQLRHDHWGWTALGFAAQGLFSMRFLIQWLASEKQKKFVMPIQFWHFSIIGGSLNLVYSLHLWKAPLIFGAVASLHAAWRHPGSFGRLVLQSGSFAFSDIGHHRRTGGRRDQQHRREIAGNHKSPKRPPEGLREVKEDQGPQKHRHQDGKV